MLEVLTTSSRTSSLHYLDIRYMISTGDKVTFHFHKLHKSWRKGNASPSLTIYSYSADKELCMVKTLTRYVDVTEKSREAKTQLLLSFKKPYRENVSSTVSGWIKTVLELANINTEVLRVIQRDWPLLRKSV